ncbi:unnamed protein product [Candida verbasci]|uniref:Uncharacterized protein n=1 Tax=Candida verbasci TaxID=1227364 RepID=A0A9W4TTL7_9ASCO|nr:unnamed protein product [Candida verbasci]
MNRVYKHPILTNPTRWLDIQKKHSCEVYHSQYPNLLNNSFAKALVNVESYSIKNTLPIGLGLQLKLNNGQLYPILWFDKVTEPTSFIINNRKLIMKMVSSKKSPFGLLSLKAKMNYPKNVKFAPGFIDLVDKLYLDQIKELLKDVDSKDGGKNGLQLIDSPTKLGQGIVNKSLFNCQDLYVDYDKHPKLARLIVSYVDYLKE